MPLHVSSTWCAYHQEVKIALHSLWYHHTCRCDEHMCSKHVEAWNKLIVKQTFFASSWLITEINILRCKVSKTSKNTKFNSKRSKNNNNNNNKIKDTRPETRTLEKEDSAIKIDFFSIYNSAHSLSKNMESTFWWSANCHTALSKPKRKLNKFAQVFIMGYSVI